MTDPYLGLRPYDSATRDRFFGRTREIRDVLTLWLANRLLIVYGASGVGKTSLLQAGVIPSLRPAGSDQEAVVLPIGRMPHAAAYPAITVAGRSPFEFALLSSWSPQSTAQDFAGVSLVELLRRMPEATDDFDDPVPLLAVIDQFEELFAEPAGRPFADELFRQLAEAIEKVERLHLLISIRDDSMGNLLPYETRIAGHSRARFRVRPLSRQQTLEAVTGPLRQTPRSFAPGVAERLVDDLRTVRLVDGVGHQIDVVGETVEPVQLQIVCSRLWDALPADVTTITAAYLQERGDVAQMLLDFCRTAVHDVATVHREAETAIWEWLAHNFITETGRRGTVYEGITSTGGMANEVAQALTERRVFKVEERSGSRWYELAHDGLILPVRSGMIAARPMDDEPDRRERDPVSYLRTAESAFAHGDFELAERYATECLAITPPDDAPGQREVLVFLGRVAAAQDAPEAEAYFRAAERYFQLPRDARAVSRLQLELGRLYLRHGETLKAQVELERALRGPGADPEIRVELGRVLRAAGQYGAALSHLQAVLIVAPNHLVALVERGLTQAAMGDQAGARADLENAVRLSPAVAEHDEVRRVLAATTPR